MGVRVIVLAAGKGTRMKSALPKVLHPLAGKPLLGHVLDTVGELEPSAITVVIGHEAEQIRATIDQPVQWAMQTEQLGTGHAVQQGLEGIGDEDIVLITYGDVPLTRASTYRQLIETAGEDRIGLLTLVMQDPTGYGRILRVGGAVVGVVEQKDATPEQLEIDEVNAGVVAIRGDHLKRLLGKLDNDNAQGEYYLTDIHAFAVREGLTIIAVHPDDAWEVDGVNSRMQLAALERLYQQQRAEELMTNGVTLADPARIDIRGTLRTGRDCRIDVNCVFEGDCEIGENVSIGPNCLIIASRIASGSVIHANSVIEDSDVGEAATIGPFARLRPGTVTDAGIRIGNFVETKKARIGKGSKINHLSYVGDAELGEDVNIGAGTITCNYDGANKHLTSIGDAVFVGSNSSLVAPIRIGDGATIGAGSTITSDIASGALGLTRAKLRELPNWSRPAKKKA